MKREGIRRILLAANHFIVFFLLIAFVITCSTMLFGQTLIRTLHLELTAQDVGAAAKITALNIVVLTVFISCIDAVRRRFMVTLPVRRITDAANRIMRGDFTARVELPRLDASEEFGEIADCINRMAKELSGIETLRSDFVASVSHELKTPLSVIRNYALMLGRADLPQQERAEYAAAAEEACGRLSDLIGNILRLNKLENQQIFPERRLYNLTEQLCACLLAFEEVWERKGISIETALEDDVLVETDEELMALVWNNLFSNAVKFTDTGGRIALRMRIEGAHVVVEVSDTGCGISKETGARIFDKFYQGDTSRASQGNGLGLALVRRVMDITGGEISVKSEVGKGSTFAVRLRRRTDGTH